LQLEKFSTYGVIDVMNRWSLVCNWGGGGGGVWCSDPNENIVVCSGVLNRKSENYFVTAIFEDAQMRFFIFILSTLANTRNK
jgi:hypothetical protein